MPRFICDTYKTFGIVVTCSGGDTDVGGSIVTSMAYSMLIMVNSCAINSFVNLVASACLCSPVSMLWSWLASIAIVSMTFYKFGRGRTGGSRGY
jgi:uncharacterized transporter YbjL